MQTYSKNPRITEFLMKMDMPNLNPKNPVMTGHLIFLAPTKFIDDCIAFTCDLIDISMDEYYLVGTQCGTSEFDIQRVEEYKSYKQHKKSMEDLVFENYNIDRYNNNRYWQNLIWKKWFGDNLRTFDIYKDP